MTLAQAIVLVALVAAVSGCICATYQSSKFEVDCRDRGGQLRTATLQQLCVTDAGVAAHDEEDAGP